MARTEVSVELRWVWWWKPYWRCIRLWVAVGLPVDVDRVAEIARRAARVRVR